MNKYVLFALIAAGILIAGILVWIIVIGESNKKDPAKKNAAISWLVKNTPAVAKNCPNMKGRVDLGNASWWNNKANSENVLKQVSSGHMPPKGSIPNWESMKDPYMAMVKTVINNI
jgi:hypothetical protein